MDPKLNSGPGTDVPFSFPWDPSSFPWDPEKKTTEVVGFLSAVEEAASPEEYY